MNEQVPSKERIRHERRVIQHASGWREQMDTCVCGRKWPCLLDRLRAARDIVDHSANNGRRRVQAPENETDAADEIEHLQSDNEATRDMLICSCAGTPPTMPVYRGPDDHLPTCPRATLNRRVE